MHKIVAFHWHQCDRRPPKCSRVVNQCNYSTICGYCGLKNVQELKLLAAITLNRVPCPIVDFNLRDIVSSNRARQDSGYYWKDFYCLLVLIEKLHHLLLIVTNPVVLRFLAKLEAQWQFLIHKDNAIEEQLCWLTCMQIDRMHDICETLCLHVTLQ